MASEEPNRLADEAIEANLGEAGSGELITPPHGDQLSELAKPHVSSDDDPGDEDADTAGTADDAEFPKPQTNEPTSF